MANNVIEASEKLEKIAKRLKENKEITMNDRQVILFNLSEIKDLLTTDEQIFISWSIDDVILHGQDRGVEVTRNQAVAILQEMEKRHDATIGINWDVIEVYLDNINDYEK